MPLYWIWFSQLNHLSSYQKQRLLEHFHDPEEIYHCREAALLDVPGLDEKSREALLDKDLSHAQQILRLCEEKQIRIVTCRQKRFPVGLCNIEDAPVLLYYRGILPDWQELPMIAVVGTRKASPYGLQTARNLCAQIAACGGIVVSGGAEGIDTQALEGALDAGGIAVAVFGGGADVIYPRKNAALFNRLLENGCILSEHPPKTPPNGWHFPRRNRLLSGMAQGVLVVEAPERSGALSTAEHAFTQGRDVYAVPGNLGVDSCVGSNLLLQKGAYAVITGWDILRNYENLYPGKLKKVQLPLEKPEAQTLGKVAQTRTIPEKEQQPREKTDKKSIDNTTKSTYSVLNKPLPRLTEEESSVYSLLTQQPQFPDGVMAQSDLPAGTVQSILTKLTLKGLVKNHPGGRISRK